MTLRGARSPTAARGLNALPATQQMRYGRAQSRFLHIGYFE
jgi:hypothetical protein